MKIAWPDIPREEANLLNPSFCSLLLWTTADAHCEIAACGLDYAVTHLVLPIVLHKPTRTDLPRSVVTSMPAWLEEFPEHKVGFGQRARALRPFTQHAIIFGVRHGVLELTESGDLSPGSRPRGGATYMNKNTDEIGTCFTKAKLIGKWFARIDSPRTIMALWGVRP